MGRKSLLTSTKKKTATNKTKSKGAVKKKTTAKKKTVAAKKTKAVKKAPLKVKSTKAKAKKSKTIAPAKKKAVAKSKKSVAAKKKVTIKDLLFKQFAMKGKKPKLLKVKKKAVKIPQAPPFITGYGKKETTQIRALLFRTFDLTETAIPAVKVKTKKTKKPAKKTPPIKKKGVSKPKKRAVAKKKRTPKEILFQAFEATGERVKPIQMKPKALKIPDPPPFISGYGKEETAKIRSLLFQKFNLGASVSAPEAAGSLTNAAVRAGKALLFKQFKGPKTSPISVNRETLAVPDAPPFVSGHDPEESKRIRTLLFKSFTVEAPKAESARGTYQESQSYEPSPSIAASGPFAKGKKFAFLLLAALVAIIVGSSYSNRSNYFLKEIDGVVQVWQGKFAPRGAEVILTLDGISMPQDVKPVYTKIEISPIVFDYMMGKADSLLDTPRGPDFGAIKQHLRQAQGFAPTPMLQKRVDNRLRGIDFVVLFHKADIAIGRGEPSDLKMAKSYLKKARSAAFTDYQRDMVTRAELVVEEAIAAFGN